jgi:hypothetical protein
MTESKWLSGNNPDTLLLFVASRASDRQLRLYACACCRRAWHLLTHPAHRRAVQTSERYADGQASDAELTQAQAPAWAARSPVGVPVHGPAHAAAPEDVIHEASAAAFEVRNAIATLASRELDGPEFEAMYHTADTAERRAQSALVRDIFGNPFRQVSFDPAWRQWQGGTVVRIARAIYAERRFADMPVLADALEEAGCASADVLEHCRAGGEHVRGCWVLDALLEER